MFMCIKKEDFLNICNLYPETRGNLAKISLKRRQQFMKHKMLNSEKYWKQRGDPPMEWK